MTSIYQIEKKYLEIFKELEETEGEITPEIEQELAISENDLKNKALNYSFFIKNLENTNDIIDAEIKRLTTLKKSNEKYADKLKEILSKAMILFGLEKIEFPTLKLSIRKSKVVNIIDETKISDNFFTTKITKTISKTSLKQALEEGTMIDGAELVINNNLQIK